jgi:GntR family transcriptional regulator
MTGGLTRELGTPLHHQLSSVLRSAIVSGRYRTDGYLPGEIALMDMFGVSRATVRRALLTLESEKLIDRHQGKGTRVLWDPSRAVGTPIDEHLRRIERGAERTTISLLGVDRVPAPVEAAGALRLPPGSDTVRITRVRRRGDTPLRHLTSYLEPGLADLIPRPDLEQVTLVEALGRVGRAVARAEDEVGATLADPAVAAALDVTIGAPLLEMARVMFDDTGDPVVCQWTLISPRRHRLRIVVEATDDEQLRPVADLTLSAAPPRGVPAAPNSAAGGDPTPQVRERS